MMPGVFSGKLIKTNDLPKRDVPVGPLPIPKVSHPVDALVKKSVGDFPYEPNGLVDFDPAKIEYLKS